MIVIIKEKLIHELASLIDLGGAPGLAAFRLARAVVSLVQDRDDKQATLLASGLETIGAHWSRELSEHDPRKEPY
jgi:hypothetical protein